jgi:hypothetical protein
MWFVSKAGRVLIQFLKEPESIRRKIPVPLRTEVAVIRITTLASILLVLEASIAAAQPKTVKIPAAIKVPDGHKLIAKCEAQGVQIYKAVAGKGGVLEWVFEGPLADLSEAGPGKAGIHYYGPAWEAADGSKVVKDDDKKVQSAEAPNPTRDLPWLLVPVKADDLKDAKPGRFSKVVYVQRVATSGGRAPKEPLNRAGSKIAVPYKAVYYFWAKGEVQESSSLFSKPRRSSPATSLAMTRFSAIMDEISRTTITLSWWGYSHH